MIKSQIKVIFYIMLFFVGCRPSHLGELAGVSKNKSLEETYWVLKELNGKAVTVSEEKKMYLQFRNVDKNVLGFVGCNQLTGIYAQNGKKIKLTLSPTKMTCSGKMETETAFLHAMGMVDEFAIKLSELSLKNGSRTFASFTAEVKTMY